MSLSSLQAQLAALNGSAGKHPGSSFATSKRHEEAVGRGLHFSVQHGHSVRTGEKFYQASILSATAREAGDVPLHVLAENCQAALQQLAGAVTSARDASFLLDMIPKITGKDQAPHKTVQELLVLITTLLAEPGDESLMHTPCWHVIEYLLRRYDLHVDHMEDLLWTIFPTADRFPAVFHRCLQLVDLASHSSYLWLRPYARDVATGDDTEVQQSSAKTKKQKRKKATSSTTVGNHVPPRQLLAQHVVKRTDLLRRVCRLAAAVVEWHDSENNDNDDSQSARRGIGHVLSFTAALLVEGLAWLEKANLDTNHSEKVLRGLFPSVLIACEGGSGDRACADWKGWGYVVASVLAETMELTPKALATLTTNILRGGKKNTSSFIERADAVAAVMAVLCPPCQYAGEEETIDNKDAFFLPLLSGQFLGCPVLPGTTRAFCRGVENSSWVASALGYLHRDRRMVVAPFVAALMVSSLLDSNDDTEADNLNFALTLLREKGLASLWTVDGKLNLSASLACWIVKDLVKQQDKKATGKLVLKTIHDISPDSCERGIGVGIQESKEASVENRISLRYLIDGVIALGDEGSGDVEDATWEFLPPRVAIEHADASIRLDAIKRLISQLEDGLIVDSETLVSALLRRLASDTNGDVALATCDALVLYFDTRQPKSPAEDLRQELEWCRCAGYLWMEKMQLDPTATKNLEILCKMFAVCAHMSKQATGSDDKQTLLEKHFVTEFLIAHVDHSNQAISVAAQRALCELFEQPREKTSPSRMRLTTRKLLLANFQSIVGQLGEHWRLTQKSTSEAAIRRQCTLAMIDAAVSTKDSNADGSDMVRAVYSLSVALLEQKLSPDHPDVSLVSRGVEWCAERMSSTADELLWMTVSLASLGAEGILDDVITQALRRLSQSLKDKAGHPVPSISVLLEAATRARVPAKATLRLVSIVEGIIRDDKPKEAALAVLPALYLTENSDREVRTGAVRLIEAVLGALSATGSRPWSSLSLVCEKIVATKSTSYMGGTALISGAFSSCAEDVDAMEGLRDNLLLLCSSLAVGCTQLTIGSFQDALRMSWLEVSPVTGANLVVTHIVNAMDVAGEKAFPLLTKWKMFGHPLVSYTILSSTSLQKPMPSFIECIVRMLKGVLLADPTLVISSGPGQAGKRARSYSFGRAEGISVLSPYPKEMTETLVMAFSQDMNSCLLREFASEIARRVIASSSWKQEVFQGLPSATRIRLAEALLVYSTSDLADAPDDVFTALPLLSHDLIRLFQTFKSDYGHLSILIEFVRVNAGALVRDSGATRLCMALYEVLQANHSVGGEDERSFVTMAALHAIRELMEVEKAAFGFKNDELSKWLNFLLAMLSRSDMMGTLNVERLASPRARSTVHAILVALCEKYPAQAVSSLISAVLANIDDACPRESVFAEGDFARLVPTYVRHASSANLSMQNLFYPFVDRGRKLGNKKVRSRLFHALANALTLRMIGDVESGLLTDAAVGGFIASYLAFEVKAVETGVFPEEACSLSLDVLSKRGEEVQMLSLLLLLQYVKQLIHLLKRADYIDSPSIAEVGGSLSPSIDCIASLPSRSKSPKRRKPTRDGSMVVERKILGLLVRAIAKVFGDGLMLPGWDKSIRRSGSDASKLSLRLWQDLLVVQSESQTIAADTEEQDEKVNWGSVLLDLGNARNFLQSVLPVTIFLASTCSIVREGGTEAIRSRALLLIADRALNLDPDSGEASLFIDTVPLALDILEDNCIQDLALKQSALVAVEHVARSLHQHSNTFPEAEQTSVKNAFVSALKRTSCLLDDLGSKLGFNSSEASMSDLVCSAALTSGALVRVVGAKCLPYLRKLLGALFSFLQAANARVVSGDKCTDAQLIQLSVVRALIALVDAAPQFLPPYLSSLLSSSTMLSSSLRTETPAEISVGLAVERFDTALTANVPARLLIPASANSLKKCTLEVEKHALLGILKTSIDNASNSEIAALAKPIFVCVTTSFEHAGPFEERKTLVETASALLLALVLKLSEVQLRRIFASFTEWKGELNAKHSKTGAERRYAYWTACGVLCRSLRSIFLPCMSMAVGDAVSELELAATGLHKLGPERLSERKKRRRLDTGWDYGQEAMHVLQPLLGCLQSALQADANQGGSWVRSDDNQKYENLLEPLGRLLRAELPADFPVAKAQSTPYQQVVMGSVDETQYGSVCGCLTALAVAGGDERLWKPLNYAVLEACSVESRPEIRKGGLTCLLSLMKSLGEEYMILLPECLPVLSDVLEDPEEEISSLGKGIVALAEELMGESLEESLR